MAWEVELNIKAPAGRVFSILANWHKFKPLRQLASIPEYNVVETTDVSEYYWIKVKDLPLVSSYCYGRRLLRSPDLLIDMFTYRMGARKHLKNPKVLDALMLSEWEKFFYQITRLERLNGKWTKLLAFDPSNETIDSNQQRQVNAFYREIKKLAEAEIVPLGINIVAEEVGAGNTEAYFRHDEFDTSGAVDAEEVEDEKFEAPSEIDDIYDPYSIMGISPNVTTAEVKQIYRNLVMRFHPDRLNSQQQAAKEYGHNRFIEVTAAYQAILRMRKN